MQQNNPHQSFFMESVQGFAKVLALISAYFFTPPFYGFTVGWVQVFSARYYGSGLDGFVSIIWFCLVACLTYQFSKATIGTALVMGGVGLMLRLMV